MDRASILIVDDDPFICNLLEDLFGGEGWAARSALTGEKALELFDQDIPDLTILDIGCRELRLQVCREIIACFFKPDNNAQRPRRRAR